MHKKYTYKNGKKYGPYLYENKRVGEKVITTYVGKDEHNSPNLFFIITSLFVIALAIVLSIILQNIFFTGHLGLDISGSYNIGDNLDGTLKLSLKPGELIPASSLVRLANGEEEVVMSLDSLINEEKKEGSFYVENVGLIGSGEGYGVPGEMVTNPRVNFKLLVKYSADNSTQEEYDSTDSNSSQIEETNISSSNEENPIVESNTEESTELESDDVPVNEEVINTEVANEELPEAQVDSTSTNSDLYTGVENDLTITGSVVDENSFVIEGSVEKGEEFSYILEEGQIAEILPGSVSFENYSLEDNILDIELVDNIVVVTTDYDIVETGFGENFVSNGEVQSYSIDLSVFGLNVSSSIINAYLEYNGSVIVSVSKDIQISEEETELPLNETVVNETFINVTEEITNLPIQIKDIPTLRIAQNSSVIVDLNEYFDNAINYSIDIVDIASELNESLLNLTPPEGFSGARQAQITAFSENYSIRSNIFNVLVSTRGVSIITTRDKIVVGEPVRWTKNISLDSPDNVTLELPLEATNISVTKIYNEEAEPAVVEFEGVVGNIINANVVAEINTDKKLGIVKWIKKLFSKMTGKAVDSGESISNTSLDIIISDNATEYIVEYYTEAPQITETLTENGKNVTISADDSLNYTDVIAFTNLPFNLSNNEISGLKIYWHNYDAGESVEIKNVSEVENNSFIEETIIIDNNSIENSPITGNVIAELEINASYMLQEMPYDYYDLSGDGLYDYIEWVVPHLSNQSFSIIFNAGANASYTNVSFYGNYTTLSINRNSVPYSNLIAYYAFDTTNSSLLDLSGNGKNGTYWNGTYTDSAGCIYGPCSKFDGVDDHIRIGAVTYGQNITYSFWVYFVSNPSFGYTLFFDDDGAGGGDSFMYVRTDGKIETQRDSDGFGVLTSNSALQTSKWNHIALTLSTLAPNKSIYINGVLDVSNNVSSASRTGKSYLTLGAKFDGNGFFDGGVYFNGSMDEFMVFNTSLSPAQIASIYNNQSARFVSQGLIETKQFNITAGDDAFNLTFSNYLSYGGTSLTARLGRWDVSKGYNNTDSSLVAYYHADGNANDSSIKSNNGTFINGANAVQKGVFNNSFVFTGANDLVNVSDHSSLTVGPQATFSTWVYPRVLGGTHQIFVGKRLGSTAEYQFGIATTNKLKFSLPTTGTTCCTDYNEDSTTLQVNNWYHITAVFNDSSDVLQWYINGINTENDTVTQSFGTDTAAPLSVGNQQDFSEAFNGTLDEVMIFNRSLTSTEIKDLYVKGRANWDYTTYRTIENTTTFPIYNSTSNVLPSFKLLSDNYQFLTSYLGSPGNISVLNHSSLEAYSCGTYSSTGNYVLKTDLTDGDFLSDGCIILSADHSNIDCEGHLLRSNSISNGFAIWVQGKNNSVKNCNVILGGANNAAFRSSNYNNTFINNTAINVSSGFYMDGSNNTFVNNSVFNATAYGFGVISIDNNNHGKSKFINNLISDSFRGFYLFSTSSGSLLKDNTINNSYGNTNSYGIYVLSNNNTFINNTLINNQAGGIWLSYVFNNTFINNTINGSGDKGIFLDNSNTTLIVNNIINNNSYGLYSDASSSNIISNNVIYNNTIAGIYATLSNSNNITDNVVHNNKQEGIYLYSGINSNLIKNNIIYNNSFRGIRLREAAGNIVLNNTLYNNSIGINLVPFSDSNEIVNNTIYSSINQGIFMDSASDSNNITGNIVFDNKQEGIYVATSYNRLMDNVAYNNSRGIYLISSESNSVINNTVYNNTREGVYVYANNDFNVHGNKAYNNTKGISLDNSYDGNATGNNIYNNSYGIYVIGSEGNKISSSNLSLNGYSLYLNASTINNVLSNLNISESFNNALYFATEGITGNNISSVLITNTNVSFYDLYMADDGNDDNYFIDTKINNYSMLGSTGNKLFFRDSTYGEIRFLQGINGSGINLTKFIVIGNNSAFVNDSISGLNRSANVTLYGLISMNAPKILRNELLCSTSICYNFTTISSSARFNVTGWSTYSIAATPLTNCGSGGCLLVKRNDGVNKTIIDKSGILDTFGTITTGSVGTPDGNDLLIRNSLGNVVSWIDGQTGNIRLSGTLSQSQGTACSPPSGSFIFRNTTGSCVGYFDSSGNLWLKGAANQYVAV